MEVESRQQILKRRKEIEAELSDMLKESESSFSLQNIKDIIFNEEGQDDLTKIISMFDNGQDFSELENILEVINDAWNYFPHKILDGLCPAEKIFKGQTSVYESYRPRNEYEMCELFEALLFMKVDEIIPEQMNERDLEAKKKLTLSEKEMETFSKSGIINRIFRRWYQTNWGYENVSNAFDGETPRQELGRIYPGIKRGKDYFSVNLEKEAGIWKIKPYYYPEAFLKSEGGLFAYGFKKLEENKKSGKVYEPFFDVEFEEFVSWLNFGSNAIAKGSKEEGNDNNDFFKYWDLFFRMAPSNIVLNLKIKKLSEQEFSDACLSIKNILSKYFSSQVAGHDDYLQYDDVFMGLWEEIRFFDSEMLSCEELMGVTKSKKGIEKFRKDAKIKKSIELMSALGILFDRYVLFPIERYFNEMELVWTNHDIFLDDLSATMLTLKGKLKSEELYNKDDNFLDTISPYELRYLWFAPCTAFRLTGEIFKYFR